MQDSLIITLLTDSNITDMTIYNNTLTARTNPQTCAIPLQTDKVMQIKQESPANAKGTRNSSACMKAHCEQM